MKKFLATEQFGSEPVKRLVAELRTMKQEQSMALLGVSRSSIYRNVSLCPEKMPLTFYVDACKSLGFDPETGEKRTPRMIKVRVIPSPGHESEIPAKMGRIFSECETWPSDDKDQWITEEEFVMIIEHRELSKEKKIQHHGVKVAVVASTLEQWKKESMMHIIRGNLVKSIQILSSHLTEKNQ